MSRPDVGGNVGTPIEWMRSPSNLTRYERVVTEHAPNPALPHTIFPVLACGHQLDQQMVPWAAPIGGKLVCGDCIAADPDSKFYTH